MTDNVIKVLFREDQKIPPDDVLSGAMGIMDEVFIAGVSNGELYVAGSGWERDAVFMFEKAINRLTNNEDD